MVGDSMVRIINAITEEKECCYNCKHFYQHYIKLEGEFTEVAEGHCSEPRVKIRRITDHCDNFKWREVSKNARTETS